MMEDWQEHSLEEKVDLKQLLLTPSDSYTNEGLSEYSEEIKEETGTLDVNIPTEDDDFPF